MNKLQAEGLGWVGAASSLCCAVALAVCFLAGGLADAKAGSAMKQETGNTEVILHCYQVHRFTQVHHLDLHPGVLRAEPLVVPREEEPQSLVVGYRLLKTQVPRCHL